MGSSDSLLLHKTCFPWTWLVPTLTLHSSCRSLSRKELPLTLRVCRRETICIQLHFVRDGDGETIYIRELRHYVEDPLLAEIETGRRELALEEETIALINCCSTVSACT